MSSEAMVKKIVKILDQKKGYDIEVLKVQELTTICDYFIIVSASNTNQTKALAEEVEEQLSRGKIEPRRIEGTQGAQWILMDYGDVIIHVFYQETREFYNIERLWKDAPRMEIAPLLIREDSVQ